MGSLFNPGPSSAQLNVQKDYQAVQQQLQQNTITAQQQAQQQADQAAAKSEQDLINQLAQSSTNASAAASAARKSQLGGFFGTQSNQINPAFANQFLDNGTPGLRANFLGR